jgi:hypothetical protein
MAEKSRAPVARIDFRYIVSPWRLLLSGIVRIARLTDHYNRFAAVVMTGRIRGRRELVTGGV